MNESVRIPFTRIEKLGLAASLVLAAVLMWPIRGYLTDDTFIHLQYATHLAQGRGLVFNLGERVYGCTSPLWVAMIADGIALGLDGLAWARALGCLATLASVVLFFQLMRRTVRTPVFRAAATLAWAGHAWMARWSLSGMETPLAVVLMLGGFVAFTSGRQWGARPVRTAALWALAALTRPEAVVLLLVWGACLLIDTEERYGVRRLIAGTLPAALIYGSWLLFARLYFHTFWPQTLAAKSAGSSTLGFQIDQAWRQVKLLGATDGVMLVVLLVALVMARREPRRGRLPAQRLVPWAWIALLPTLYLARGVPVISRYLLPLAPVVAWLAWRAAERWWLPDPADPVRARRGAALAAALALAVLAQNFYVYRTAVLPHVDSFSPALEAGLARWGRWFATHSDPQAVIATPDIGAIGYFSRRRVVDLAGLVTPAMVPLLARQPEEDIVADFGFAAFARPEYLVDREPEPYGLVRRSPWGASLVPLGQARMPNLGIARPEPTVYSFYRIDWPTFDSLRAARAHPPSPPAPRR